MIKKSLYGIIALFVVGLSLYSYSMVSRNGEGVTAIDSTKEVSLDEFLSLYQSGSFAIITEKNLTDLYGDMYRKTEQSPKLFSVGGSVEVKHYDRFATKKSAVMTLPEMGISLSGQTVNVVYESGGFMSILFEILPFLLMLILIVVFFRFFGPKGGGGFPFSIKIGKLNTEKDITTKFSDIAGMEEVKEDLYEIIDYLKNPEKYAEVGARPPKGILLYGAPGSGKTLLAKAVAGEADASFFSASGSEFMEMLVGMGAAKVRELFSKAKAASPSIIFIDEIDAIGKRRGGGYSGGHQEQEQTLNQILTEMDGFDTNTNVIVIAATNRPDVLDPALMRSGRFDRKIMVGSPTLEERKKIIEYYLLNKKVETDLSVDFFAKRTSGFVGADIENMINEASLKIARDGRKKITAADLEFAFEKVVMGSEKKIKSMIDKERLIISYHELGHAVCGYHLSEADPVEKISIVARGRALGVTITLPDEDRYLHSKKKFLHEVTMLLGGRAAEEIFMGRDEITTGASNDFMRATNIVRDMIAKYGMDDDIGQILFTDRDDESMRGGKWYSEETAKAIDAKIKTIITECYTDAKKIITDHRDPIESMKNILLEKEYLTKEEFEEGMTRA